MLPMAELAVQTCRAVPIPIHEMSVDRIAPPLRKTGNDQRGRDLHVVDEALGGNA